ncbi:MAG: nucleotide sugar dehydrogenase [Thermoguttaceae bacterium]
MVSSLEKQIEGRSAVVGVVGLGYVGLPLLRAFIAAGFRTIGFDVDPKKVESIKAGKSYIAHISSDWIRECVETKKLDPTADMTRLAEADAILLCVPTPLNETRDPDLQYVEQTTRSVAKTLRRGQLVVLESTTYPGTTRDVMLPILEEVASERGLKLGVDYFLAYSPEREDPGNPDFSAERIPKVVGGCDETSGRIAVSLYQKAIGKVVPVSSCEIAEAAKILENTYRLVNIAMVNELKVLFTRLGIDVWEVIDAAKTKPFGFQAFYPGPGLGGHCIPIDPFYLSWCARKAGMTTRFIELAGEINRTMPLYVVRKLADALNDAKKAVNGSRILVLGAAYKKDVDDPRESPSFELIELLLERGAAVDYNDPHIPRLPKMRSWPTLPAMESVALTPQNLASYDAVLIATDHSAYNYNDIVRHSRIVVDSRNATGNVTEMREKIVKC